MNSVYLGKPRKQMTEDGLRLGRHLRNRGRPAHSTWTKYKQQRKGKREERFDGMLLFTGLYFCFLFHVEKTLKSAHTQVAFTCSKLTVETLEQGVKYVQS